MIKILLLGLFFSAHTHAFTVMNASESRFVNPEVAIDVSSSSCRAVGMSPDEILNLAIEAVDKYWNRVAHCSLKLVRGNVVDVPVTTINIEDESGNSQQLRAVLDNIGNNRILLGCNENSKSFQDNAQTLALGFIYNNRGLVFINSSADNIFQKISRNQQLAVLAHEIGHAIGLGHSADPVALMYYDVSGKIQEKLNVDDFDGCAYLYPHEFPGNCSFVPYVKQKDNFSDGGGIGYQTLLASLILGFVLVVILGGGVARLWRDWLLLT